MEVHRRVKDLLDGIREQTLRMLRGMEVLERIGTSAARKVLASLAEGTVDVRSQGCPATPALIEAEQDQAMAGSRAARSAQ